MRFLTSPSTIRGFNCSEPNRANSIDHLVFQNWDISPILPLSHLRFNGSSPFSTGVLQDSLLLAVRHGPSSHLRELMSLLVNAVVRAPFWFGKQRQLLVDALKARVAADPALEQALDFVRMSRGIRSHDEHKFNRFFPRASSTPGSSGAIAAAMPAPPSSRASRMGSGDFSTLLFDDGSRGFQALKCFEKLGQKKLRRKGAVFEIPEDTLIFHPMQNCGRPLRRLHVLDVFNTNAKPLLLEVTTDENRHPSAAPASPAGAPLPPVTNRFILKTGDDLRQDMGVLSVFRAVNYFWAAEKLEFDGHPVEAHIYECVAMSDKMGVIEFVAGCHSMTHVKTVAQNGESRGHLCGWGHGD